MTKRFNQTGKVKILCETTDEPITLIGEMAGICWGADTSTQEKNYKRGIDCLKSQHGRTFEYPQIYLEIDGYSARVIREFTRHVGGQPTYLQASTRYIDYINFDYIVPPSVAEKEYTNGRYANCMQIISNTIDELVAAGVPREDAAMLLPLGMETKIVMRTNLRNLIDMAKVRMCFRANWEFRQLFNDILHALCIYSDEWAILVKDEKVFRPRCEILGYCPEKNGCGRFKHRED